ncbi:Ferrichrome outer membrane transporter/phage receptor [Sporomusa termitida]|uniref:Ferrichrome outer membrane transporter/phage receptor n=1 Tax=Sporomusa termitida TaxID=2377 RepID=A0A517DQ55_9FIRM|nr:Ferrichrome outer membrane transporter/phage receptor [Sporomusa termitida]
MEYSAGVHANLYGNDTRWNWSYVRGFSVGNSNTTVDGLQLFDNGNFGIWDFETYGMEQVGIIKGPASVTYGGSSPGGLFNMTTKRPTSQTVREVQLQGGTDSFKSAAIDIGGQADGQEKVTFRLTALARDRDLPANYTWSKRTFIAPSLGWQPDKDTNITFQAHYLKDRLAGGGQALKVYYPNHSLYGFSEKLNLGENGWGGYEREQYYFGYLLDHTVNKVWTLHQNFRYGQVDMRYNMTGSTLQEDGRTLKRTAYIYDETLDAYTFDTYGEAKWTGGAVEHTALVGIDYRHADWTNRYVKWAITDLDIYDLNYTGSVTEVYAPVIYKAKAKQTGIYLQDQMKFGGKWVATVSGRQDWYQLNGVNPQTGDKTTIDQDAFTGRAGLVYHATSELSPYISYSESFEPQSGADRNKNPFKPTTGRQYELGVQYEPQNRNARFTAAVFDLRRQNVLTADPLNTENEYYNVQTGEVTSKGLELEANVALSNLNLTASYTLLNAKTTKSNTAAEVGLRTTGVPRQSASLWADYAVPGTKLKGLGIGAGVRYIGPTYFSANTVRLGGVVVADAQLHYETAGWRYALNVRNVFDKQYQTYAYSTYGVAGEGRAVLLTATHRW